MDGFVLGLSQGETVELGACGWVSRSSALPLPPPVIRGPGSLRCAEPCFYKMVMRIFIPLGPTILFEI